MLDLSCRVVATEDHKSEGSVSDYQWHEAVVRVPSDKLQRNI
jgi:hypothetical protein